MASPFGSLYLVEEKWRRYEIFTGSSHGINSCCNSSSIHPLTMPLLSPVDSSTLSLSQVYSWSQHFRTVPLKNRVYVPTTHTDTYTCMEVRPSLYPESPTFASLCPQIARRSMPRSETCFGEYMTPFTSFASPTSEAEAESSSKPTGNQIKHSPAPLSALLHTRTFLTAQQFYLPPQ